MTPIRKITLMLADDHHGSRQMFNSLIKEKPDHIAVIGEAANGQELLTLLEKQQPDIVILDLQMPVLDGYSTLKLLTQNYPEVKVIIFSTDYSEFYISELILAGARSFLSKTEFATQAFNTIRAVFKHGFSFDAKITSHLLQTLIEDNRLKQMIGAKKLNEKEIAYLQVICDEKQNKELAASLADTGNTVEYYKQQLYAKNYAISVVGLVKHIIRVGVPASVI